MKGEPVQYKYHTSLEWTSEKKGILHCKDKPDIEVACPPEFGGHAGIWSPEDLFLASVEVCTLTTFLWFIKKKRISIHAYSSEATGVVELAQGFFQFSSITVHVRVRVPSEDDRLSVERILKKNVEKACLITNSIHSKVTIQPDVSVE